jgi:uncharacterized membrane protein
VAAGVSGLLAALLLLGAQAAAEEPYHALGTEPFWSVSIENGRISFESMNGPNFSADAPAPQPIYNGRVYAADRLILNLTHAQCSDGMSDSIYADTVTVTVDGVTHRGCGGGTVTLGTMANSHWSIDEIDGEPVFERGYFLEFDAERFTGRAGCNRLSGAYAREGERLTLGPVAATRMACPEPGMGHERRALAILGGPVMVSPEEGEGMILTGAGGRLLLRRIVN